MGIFGKDKKQEGESSPSLDEFLLSLRKTRQDSLVEVESTLRDLEITNVRELASKSFQFYQRYFGEAAEIIRDHLKRNYNVELRDLSRVMRAPGDLYAIDPHYQSPNF